MSDAPSPRHRSHGTGAFSPQDFRAIGPDCVFEAGVMVFHPENIRLGRNVYVGHQSILKGYYRNEFSHRRRDLDRAADVSCTPPAG